MKNIEELDDDPIEGAALICSAIASTLAMADKTTPSLQVMLAAMISVWDALDVDYQGQRWKLAFRMQCQAVISGFGSDYLGSWASACSALREPGIGHLETFPVTVAEAPLSNEVER